MPAVELQSVIFQYECNNNPFPPVLHTPAGLAVIEIQGTINAPPPFVDSSEHLDHELRTARTLVGRLEFPLYDAQQDDGNEGKWMKKVNLYIGRFQRLTGEVKKLSKPYLVIGKKGHNNQATTTEDSTEREETLEILAVARYKILFAGRPEPVGD